METLTAGELRAAHEQSARAVAELFERRATEADREFIKDLQLLTEGEAEEYAHDELESRRLPRALRLAMMMGPGHEGEELRAAIAITAQLQGDDELATVALESTLGSLQANTRAILDNLRRRLPYSNHQ